VQGTGRPVGARDPRSAGYLSLEPGDFAVVTVREEIALGPLHAGRFGLRSKYARKGLIATTGPQIDPGFHGRLILGFTNLTPKAITVPHLAVGGLSSFLQRAARCLRSGVGISLGRKVHVADRTPAVAVRAVQSARQGVPGDLDRAAESRH